MNDLERFQAKTIRSGTCLVWVGAVGTPGYGIFWYQGKYQTAHRVAWKLAYGAILDGRCVCHTCDVRLCVEPTHLFLGTRGDNIRDAQMKGRLVGIHSVKTHCPHGHPYTPENTYTDPRGRRRCRTCRREDSESQERMRRLFGR